MNQERHPSAGSPHRPHQFTIVFRDRSGRRLHLLQTHIDANDATMAFHAELRDLQSGHITGELMVVRNNELTCPVLRQLL